MNRAAALGWCAAIVVASAGCSGTSGPGTAAGNEEGPVKETFQAFQAALKARDSDKIWALLDKDSQAAAEDRAKTLREHYAQTPDGPARAAQAKALGLQPPELAKLTGPGFLKCDLFLLDEKNKELPESRISKPPSVQGDRATVYYVEPDDDKQTLTLVKVDGHWKVSIDMPSVKKP
jgi:hypothetical protein